MHTNGPLVYSSHYSCHALRHLKESRRHSILADACHKYHERNANGRRASMLFRHPRTTGSSYSLLKPFTKTVWLCTLLSWGIMMAAIHFVNWLDSRRQRDTPQDHDHSWGATILTIFGAISEQGNSLLFVSVDPERTGPSGRAV